MSNQEAYVPEVVVIHSGGVDPGQLVYEAGIASPVSISSFTDTHPKQNPLNDDIWLVSSRADHLLIENILFDSMSNDTESARSLQIADGRPHTFRIFKSGVGVTRIVAAVGYDRSKLPVVELEEAI